jgi:aspartyl-tRNA(Asn)/glutamyl-tRNA(Gln) amidotransferase subunit A
MPLAIKDNILISGRKATAASKILEGYVAPYDATVISKLKKSGAIFLGRTNMDEFAMGSSTENSAFGPTKNPLDPTRVPGGTSGGSAAAVAANCAVASLGSDTGGSIREPAAFCGIVAFKPTYGAVSRHGLMAMGSSLDCIGPLTKTVSDSEIIFKNISGLDPMDSTTYGPEIYKESKSKKKMVIGVPYHLLEQNGIEESTRKNFLDSIKKLEKLDFETKEITLADAGRALAVYYIIMPAELSTNLARFDGVRFGLHTEGKDLLDDYFKTRGKGFGPESRRRIIMGSYVLSSGYYDAYYNKAIYLRRRISDEYKAAFENVDIIATPTTTGPAFKIGEKVSDPLSMYLADIFTVTANIVGIPAISIPSGTVSVDGKDLPLGLQLSAAHGQEQILFEAGKKFLGE